MMGGILAGFDGDGDERNVASTASSSENARVVTDVYGFPARAGDRRPRPTSLFVLL
jgi:hypothetical protein